MTATEFNTKWEERKQVQLALAVEEMNCGNTIYYYCEESQNGQSTEFEATEEYLKLQKQLEDLDKVFEI